MLYLYGWSLDLSKVFSGSLNKQQRDQINDFHNFTGKKFYQQRSDFISDMILQYQALQRMVKGKGKAVPVTGLEGP
jgi:thermostable 8-oxoguanine DNA glycosylase